MPIDPSQFQTGGALQGAVAASLLAHRAAAAELEVGRRVGIYRVLRELGRGGMAIVYLAERADGEYEQRVALKWLQGARPDATTEILFLRERQALADLRHPHIARLLDGGRSDDGRPWFAMEYIEGERLDLHCVRNRLPRAQRIALLLQVCAATAFAHARGVIHRDIKPSNVMVDSDGSAKLLDFGIARLLGQDDGPGLHAYTPGFASPEQVRGERPTIASDIYQLGRLTAAVLSADEDEHATIVEPAGGRLTRREPASAASHASAMPAALPADLRAILARACALEPASRYASADALATDLAAFVAHRPVAARGRGAAYLAQRWVRRHPFAAVAATLVFMLVVGGSLYFTQRLRAERDVANLQRALAERERDAASEARAATEAVNRFLNEDLLDAANPLRRPPGAQEVTVREALAAAESRVAERFAGQPAIATEVLTTLGTLHYEFGDDARADSLYQRAAGTAEGLPPAHAASLRLRAERAALLITMQRFDEAVATLERLLRDAGDVFPAADPRRFEWELRLLEARSGQGSDASFVPAFRALRDRIEQALGAPNALAGEASLIAANALVFSGKPDQALADAESAHRHLSATLGPDHPSTLKALTSVAHGQRAQGNETAAVAAMREAFRLQTARYGRDAGDSLFLQNELAFTLSAIGELAEAEALFADLVERRSRQSRGSTPYVQALGNLATTHYRQGRFDAALADYERAATVLASDADVAPQVLTNIERGRGDALRELGRFDAAAAAYEASGRAATNLPPNDVRRLALQGSRARLLLATGHEAEGRALLDAAIEGLQANVAPNHAVLKALIDARDAASPQERHEARRP